MASFLHVRETFSCPPSCSPLILYVSMIHMLVCKLALTSSSRLRFKVLHCVVLGKELCTSGHSFLIGKMRRKGAKSQSCHENETRECMGSTQPRAGTLPCLVNASSLGFLLSPLHHRGLPGSLQSSLQFPKRAGLWALSVLLPYHVMVPSWLVQLLLPGLRSLGKAPLLLPWCLLLRLPPHPRAAWQTSLRQPRV